MDELTVDNVKEYMDTNYGGTKLNVECLVSACQWVSRTEEIGEVDLFHLLIENQPIKGLFTHSYGFHTRAGRYLIQEMSRKYYEHLKGY